MDPDSRSKFSKAAYSCLKEQARRPNMGQVVDELERALELQLNRGKSLEHLKIPLSDIKLSTNNFSTTYEFFEAKGYFSLYRAELDHFDKENPSSLDQKNKGELPKRQNTVTVKRFLYRNDTRGEESFLTELKLLTTCKHHNIVTLLGYCDEGSEMILVIEQLSYLTDYLTNINVMPILTWAKRLEICLDVAYGLNYLHSQMIINRDIRSDYIALDENWRAKIVDFGFSVFIPQDQDGGTLLHDRQIIDGTIWYIDPEYMTTGKLKKESDVYCFGVVLFEILCGRKAYDPLYLKESDKGLAHVARRCMYEGKLNEMIDPIIKNETGKNNLGLNRGPNKDSLDTFIKIAYQCVAETQDQRPTMEVVIKELEKASSFEEKKSQSLDMDQVVHELEKPSTLHLANENPRKNLEHLRIPLSDIRLATHNFSSRCHIFEIEGYYGLYKAELDHFDNENPSSIEGMNKGELPKRRDTVVIKRFLPREDKQPEKRFLTEIEMLTTCKHQNVVTLLGFCDEGSEMILVVEYLSRGYLGLYLENINVMPILTWAKRLEICLDVANGLNYLHSEMIIHCDVRSDHIVLDKNWRAKIADFTVCVLLPLNQDGDALLHDEQSILGTIEYMDPEYLSTGRLKRESDVYSFGVLMFEILCGRMAYDAIYLRESDKGLVHVAKGCFSNGKLSEIIDPKINEDPGEKHFVLNRGVDKDSLDTFIKIAYECVAETQDQRPSMKDVIKELEKAITFQDNYKNFKISLEDIKLATENFHPHNCIGRGGFGKVFIGKVPKDDEFNTIVVKQLDTRGGQGEQQFFSELQILYEYKHENVIRLLGYCNEKDDKILVYEYASRGSLDNYLEDHRLTWMVRLNICVDVATALDFLHGGAGKQAKVIHRDIKTANILLDDDWKAKLADFGLSLISAINQETDNVIDHVCGIQGYLDPLYRKSSFLTIESDIYSFGVVLFEILCGRSTYDVRKREGRFLQDFVKQMFEEGKHDEVAFEAIKEQIKQESLTTFQRIAFQCLEDDREKRPTAKEVLAQLKMAVKIQEEQGVNEYLNQLIIESSKTLEHQLTRENLRKNLEHLRIPLSDIKLATHDFSSRRHFLEIEGFHRLYKAELDHFDNANPSSIEGMNKGELPKRRDTVAIKRFLPREDKQREERFLTEIEMLTTCKHQNVVTLLGFCDEGSEMIIVVEYLSRGYLGLYLAKINDMPILTWAKRLEICLDVANGLNYLHSEMIIHCDVRSDHIVLDENWRAKIADFTVSILLPQDGDALLHDEQSIVGTIEYTDPEYLSTGRLKRESDVYSFGVLMFEILCGRLAYDAIYLRESDKGLVHVAKGCFSNGKLSQIIDPKINEDPGEKHFVLNRGVNKDSLDTFIKIAYECVVETQDERPSMKDVIKELEKAITFQENYKNFKISLEDIKLATENFHPHNCIGRGGFGKVFIGKVPKDDGFNTIVAKQLDTRGGQGEQQFLSELQILYEYKHENVIRLLGYCNEKDDKILVYEYASRGSLDNYLEDHRLTWMVRLNICVDVATALDFLHGGAGKQAKVIHRDIKTANILLDDDWKAKLADFGLSLISAINQETDYVFDHACGTPGYLDPLYRKSSFLTIESDIYSFGVVLFEILCGRSTYDVRKREGRFLQDFVKHMFEEGKHDEVVFEAIKEQIKPESLTTFQRIAFQCLEDDREKRPTAKEVLAQLKMAVKFQED